MEFARQHSVIIVGDLLLFLNTTCDCSGNDFLRELFKTF